MRRQPRRLQLPQVADHNAAHWLEPRWFATRPASFRQIWGGPGWYLVRVCPCHPGEPVGHNPFDSEAAARRLAAILVGASEALGR
jgi:hypothetical protein